LYKELTSLFTAYRSNPIFGVEYTVEAETPELNELVKPRVEEDVEVEENVEDNHVVATYLAEEEEELDDNEVQSPYFDARLGLSVERLPGEATTESLWRVL
jgi:Bardet-Biedl syndrome 5 protein